MATEGNTRHLLPVSQVQFLVASIFFYLQIFYELTGLSLEVKLLWAGLVASEMET